MIELINIFISILVLFLISFFPLNLKYYNNNFPINNNCTYDFLAFNLIINILILFFLSFSKISYSIYFLVLISLSIISNLLIFNKIKNLYNIFLNRNFFLFLFAFIIISINLSGDPTLTWDGIENWYFKAQNFFYNYNFFDLNNLRGINYYPHLGGLLWGFFWKNSLLQYEYVGRFIYLFVFLLSIFSISDLLKNKTLKPIFQILLTLICYDRFLFGGYQDILLFSILIFLSKYFYIYMKNEDRKILFLCFILLNFLPWIKNEGYLLLGVFTLSQLMLIKLFKKKLDIIIFILFSICFVIIKNYIFYKYLNVNPTHGANLDFVFKTEQLIEFFFLLFQGVIISIFKYKIWIFILLAIFYGIKNIHLFKKDKNYFYFLILNLIMYSSLIFIIYFNYLDEQRGLYWWIHTTLDRLLYSISGFFVILTIMVINFNKIHILK